MPEVAGSIPFARLGFFRYETGALSHQLEAESTVRFFSILISWRVLIQGVWKKKFTREILNKIRSFVCTNLIFA